VSQNSLRCAASVLEDCDVCCFNGLGVLPSGKAHTTSARLIKTVPLPSHKAAAATAASMTPAKSSQSEDCRKSKLSSQKSTVERQQSNSKRQKLVGNSQRSKYDVLPLMQHCYGTIPRFESIQGAKPPFAFVLFQTQMLLSFHWQTTPEIYNDECEGQSLFLRQAKYRHSVVSTLRSGSSGIE
jgi:hypothetical protein